MSDDEARALLERIRRGDIEAYSTFHKAFLQMVYRIAKRILRTHEDAEEVMVDTMHVVWNKAGAFEGRSSVKTWVTGIAENKTLEAYRKRKKQWAGRTEIPDDSDGGEFEEWPSGEDLSEILEKAQDAERVRRCMAKLSYTHRDIVMLRFDGDKTEQEIAHIMGIPLGSVKSGFFNARGQLKKCFQGSNAGKA